jgi:hypothetical protein
MRCVRACLLAVAGISAPPPLGRVLTGFLFRQEGAAGLENYCSITIDGSGGLGDDILQQRLQSIVQQREQLQQVEIELRAQALAHPQILEAQRSFQAAAKEHATAAAKLKVTSCWLFFQLSYKSTCNLTCSDDLVNTA